MREEEFEEEKKWYMRWIKRSLFPHWFLFINFRVPLVGGVIKREVDQRGLLIFWVQRKVLWGPVEVEHL